MESCRRNSHSDRLGSCPRPCHAVFQPARRNVKREVCETLEDRDQQVSMIQQENLKLLLRMQEIEHRTPALSGMAETKPGSPHVSSELPVRRKVGSACARGASAPAAGKLGSRANARLQELRRIDSENLRLLRKLQDAKPAVRVTQLNQMHQVNQKVMLMRRVRRPPESQVRATSAATAAHNPRRSSGLISSSSSHALRAPAPHISSSLRLAEPRDPENMLCELLRAELLVTHTVASQAGGDEQHMDVESAASWTQSDGGSEAAWQDECGQDFSSSSLSGSLCYDQLLGYEKVVRAKSALPSDGLK